MTSGLCAFATRKTTGNTTMNTTYALRRAWIAATGQEKKARLSRARAAEALQATDRVRAARERFEAEARLAMREWLML
jgi:hypothetical protein